MKMATDGHPVTQSAESQHGFEIGHALVAISWIVAIGAEGRAGLVAWGPMAPHTGVRRLRVNQDLESIPPQAKAFRHLPERSVRPRGMRTPPRQTGNSQRFHIHGFPPSGKTDTRITSHERAAMSHVTRPK